MGLCRAGVPSPLGCVVLREMSASRLSWGELVLDTGWPHGDGEVARNGREPRCPGELPPWRGCLGGAHVSSWHLEGLTWAVPWRGGYYLSSQAPKRLRILPSHREAPVRQPPPQPWHWFWMLGQGSRGHFLPWRPQGPCSAGGQITE